MNIVLANAVIKNGNMGCIALSITIMSLIDDIMKAAHQKYNLYLPDSQFYDGKEHYYQVGCNKQISYSDAYYPTGLTIKENIKQIIKDTIKRKWSTRKTISQADFILDIGQGDSFADIYGEHRFKTIDRIHKLALKYHKPYCILPQTIGPFKDEKVRQQAHISIANASVCMTRDKQSFNYVKENVPEQKKVKEYIDVAFFMPYDVIKQDKKYTHIGVNISTLIWNGGYTKDNQFGLKCDYQKTIRAIIEYFLKQPDTKVHLVPHVVGAERHIENDYAVSYDLWREYANQNLVIAPFALSPVDIKSYIAGLDFFVGARMHATIGAFSSYVPVVPMAYSRKFNGLFLDTLDYPYMCDMKTQTIDEILNVIKDAYTKRNELKASVTERVNGIVAERKQELINDLKDFFKI